MFTTVHDAILLIIALLYLVIGLIRNAQRVPGARYAPGWFTLPLWIAAGLAITAVLW